MNTNILQQADDKIKYNLDLMIQAAVRNDRAEFERFQSNITMMLEDVADAIKYDDAGFISWAE